MFAQPLTEVSSCQNKKKGIFEKRTKDSYTMINYDHAQKVHLERLERGLKSKFSESYKNRTYENIPKYKVFDFLRKAFEECEWSKIKKFRFKGNTVENVVNAIYWDYELCGYVLRVKYSYKDPETPEYTLSDIFTVKDVNCLDPICYLVNMNNIEVIERD